MDFFQIEFAGRLSGDCEIIAGGSMNMPMLISTDDTATSITMKGRKSANPIWNEVRSSLITNAEVSITSGTSLTRLATFTSVSQTSFSTTMPPVALFGLIGWPLA